MRDIWHNNYFCKNISVFLCSLNKGMLERSKTLYFSRRKCYGRTSKRPRTYVLRWYGRTSLGCMHGQTIYNGMQVSCPCLLLDSLFANSFFRHITYASLLYSFLANSRRIHVFPTCRAPFRINGFRSSSFFHDTSSCNTVLSIYHPTFLCI